MSNKVRTEIKQADQPGARSSASSGKTESQSSFTLPLGADHIFQQTRFDLRALHPHDLLRFQRTVGNRAVQRMLATRSLQAKLTVGAAHDPYEEEADRVAEQVVWSGKIAGPIAALSQPIPQIAKVIRRVEASLYAGAGGLSFVADGSEGMGKGVSEYAQHAERKAWEAGKDDVKSRMNKNLTGQLDVLIEVDKGVCDHCQLWLENVLLGQLHNWDQQFHRTLATRLYVQVKLKGKSAVKRQVTQGATDWSNISYTTKSIRDLSRQELKKIKADIYTMRRKPLIEQDNTPNDEGELQTKSTAACSFDTGSDFESRLNVMRGGGTPLPEHVREFMERRFGADFSGVRLHTGSESARLNQEVNAHAFTLGRDIYLGEDKTDLESMEGKRLLAHELMHTLQQGATVSSLPPLQRRVKLFQDETGKNDMKTLAGVLSDCVDLSKAVVDGNPLLKNVQKRDEGYLKAWVTTFNEFTSTGEVPSFFYARYGYAIETIATRLFMAKDHNGYKVDAQVTYGGTRPDFVIREGSTDVAWLDITSSGSKEHIYDKQGGGWKTRPYVAEILYDMPDPTAFADTAKSSLSPEQVKALKEADRSRAQREWEFDKGMRAMGLLLGEAYAAAYKRKGEGLSRKDVKDTTVEVCQEHLGKFLDKKITPKFAAGVLASIESIEVAGEIKPGLSWANWSFDGGGDRATGRTLLWEFGKAE